MPSAEPIRSSGEQVEAIASHFAETGFNFKQVIKDWVLSDFYRADGLATAEDSPERLAELDDVGVVRMLSPEQLERKITAVFGQPWGRLTEQTAMLYGGIDSKEVTERAADPSGAMGAIQRTLANDVACRNVALDFSRDPDKRLLFPDIEPDVLPGASPESDAADSPRHRASAPARAGPIRRGRFARSRSHLSNCSPASSPMPRDQGRIRTARDLELPPRTGETRPRSALHGPRLACRGDVPAAAT